MVCIDLKYEGALRCSAIHGPSQNTLITDAPVDNCGKGEAFSPTDLVATALGSCMLTIMGIVADRAGIDISGATASVTKEMASSPVRRIGKLTVTINIPRELSRDDQTRLENGAMACPVKQSLHPDVECTITFTYG